MEKFKICIPDLIKVMFYAAEMANKLNTISHKKINNADDRLIANQLHTLLGICRIVNTMLDDHTDLITEVMSAEAEKNLNYKSAVDKYVKENPSTKVVKV